MPVITLGSLVMESQSSTQQPQAPTYEEMKRCGAKVVRGEGQAKYKDMAADGIQAAIDDINLHHFWQFGSKRFASTGQAITEADNSVSIQADFFAVRDVQLLEKGTTTVFATLEYTPWEQFNALAVNQNETGTPARWTVRNTFDDEEILLYPIPDASAAADYNVRTEYYERVPRPSDDSDIMDVPRELAEIICTYARWHILFILDGGNTARADRMYNLYREKLRAFRSQHDRQPSQNTTFQLGYEYELGTDQFDVLSD